MDALDVRIVREMGIRPYSKIAKDPAALKPAWLAKRIGVTVDTIKARLREMERDGVIAGYQIVPNLRHLGLRATAFYFPNAARDESAVAGLAAVDGLLEVHDFLGGGLCVEFAYPDDAARDARVGAIKACTGDTTGWRFHEWDMPDVSRALTPLDWRILQALRGDAKQSAGALADGLGVSARTVKRRRDRLAAEGSFIAFPVVDASKPTGLIVFEQLVYLDAGATAGDVARVMNAFSAHAIHADVPASTDMGHVDLMLVAASPSDVESLRRKAAELPGVARVDAWLFRGVLDRSAWLDELIADRVTQPPLD